MWLIILLIACILSVFPSVQAGQVPIIEFPSGMPYDEVVQKDAITFWINSQDSWRLDFSADESLKYRIEENWRNMKDPLFGDSTEAGGIEFSVDFAYIYPWADQGETLRQLNWYLTNCVALVVIEDEDYFHFYPENSAEFILKTEEAELPLTDNWQAVAKGNSAEVYWQDTLAFQTNDVQTLQTIRPANNQKYLKWITESFLAELGEQQMVELEFVGKRGTSLVLETSDSVGFIKDKWRLNGESIQVKHEGNTWILEIEETNNYVLQATIVGKLSFAQEHYIEARYLEEKVKLYGLVPRGWFSELGQVALKVTKDGEIAPDRAFLLPNGSVEYTDANGYLEVEIESGLQQFISLDSKIEPIWVEVRPGQIQQLDIDLAGFAKIDEYLIWDLVYEEDLAWQLQIENQLVHGLFSPKERVHFKGDYGWLDWEYHENSDMDFNIALNYPTKHQQYVWGDWYWLVHNNNLSGSLTGDNWRLQADFQVKDDIAGLEFFIYKGPIQLFLGDAVKAKLNMKNTTLGINYKKDNLSILFKSKVSPWQLTYCAQQQELAGQYQGGFANMSLKKDEQGWEYQLSLIGGSAEFGYQYKENDMSKNKFSYKNHWELPKSSLSFTGMGLLSKDNLMLESRLYWTMPVFDNLNFVFARIDQLVNQKHQSLNNYSIEGRVFDSSLIVLNWNRVDKWQWKFALSLPVGFGK